MTKKKSDDSQNRQSHQ